MAEGEDRWQNVLELERAASNPKFSGVADDGALESFLNEIALMGGDDIEDERKKREEEEAAAAAGVVLPVREATRAPMIQLMTVHASKGLEFDTVFLTGLESGTFPVASAFGAEMDEERRLMWVFLLYSGPDWRGGGGGVIGLCYFFCHVCGGFLRFLSAVRVRRFP